MVVEALGGLDQTADPRSTGRRPVQIHEGFKDFGEGLATLKLDSADKAWRLR